MIPTRTLPLLLAVLSSTLAAPIETSTDITPGLELLGSNGIQDLLDAERELWKRQEIEESAAASTAAASPTEGE
jgi:hypothetical protein